MPYLHYLDNFPFICLLSDFILTNLMEEIYINCWRHVKNMQREANTSEDFQNCDKELKDEKPFLRTVKSCPKCRSIRVTYRKWKRDYCCRNCLESFKDPVFKQIKDRRNILPVPPTLKGQHITEQTDESRIRIRNRHLT